MFMEQLSCRGNSYAVFKLERDVFAALGDLEVMVYFEFYAQNL